MQTVMELMIISFGLNVYLGIWRIKAKKFSLKWFIAIHITMPLIYMLRVSEGLGYWSIPLFVASAVLGQLVGGWSSKEAYKLNLYFQSQISVDNAVNWDTLTGKEQIHE